jgi:hypothetical protein
MIAATAACALPALLALALAPAAQAGQWHQYTCREPNGSPAPTDGWTGSISGSFMFASNSCSSSGGGLDARLDGAVAHGANSDIATWAYSAPGNTTLAAATLYRYAYAEETGPNATSVAWLAAPSDAYSSATIFDQCVNASGCTSEGTSSSPMDGSNRVAVPASNISGATGLYTNASCGGANGYSCPASGSGTTTAETVVYEADLTIQDPNTPTVNNVAGPLSSASTLSGSPDVSFTASDSGGGIYAGEVYIDDKLQESQVLDANGGRCADVGQTTDGTHAFLYRNPCKASVSADLAFDTTKIADGQHQLSVKVQDAAGNKTFVVAPRTVTISNKAASAVAPRGAVNGTAASDHAAFQLTTRTTLSTTFGHSAFHIRGRLVNDSGQPISQATIGVLSQTGVPGASAAQLTQLVTATDGTFDALIPPGPSRTVQLTYRSHTLDTAYAATASVTQRVTVGIKLHISPRRTGPHGVIRLRGRVLGGFTAPRGRIVELQVKYLGGWRVFMTVRSKPDGRFHASYGFLGARGTFPFRAQVRGDDPTYPFDLGRSPVIRIRTG